MSVPPELLYDIIAYAVADYIDHAITTPPARDCFRIRNLLDEERKLREAEGLKKALYQAPSNASVSVNMECDAGERADMEQLRESKMTADDNEWPIYDLTHFSDFHSSSDAEKAVLCETWEAQEAEEPLPENNIVHLLRVSRFFRDTASKVLHDTLDVQDGHPGSPLKTLKAFRRAYRIAHARTHPIYERHKGFICNLEYMHDATATPLLCMYTGVISLAHLLTVLLRRFSSLDEEQWCPLFVSHGSLSTALIPIPRGTVCARVEKRVAYYLIAFDTLLRLRTCSRNVGNSAMLLRLGQWESKEIADCEEQIKNLEIAMDTFIKLDEELDVEMLVGPVVPCNWIHALDIPWLLENINEITTYAPEWAEHPTLKRLWGMARPLFRKWCARTTASPFIMLP